MIKTILFAFSLLITLPFSPARQSAPQPLTVMSYNIRLGSANDGTNSWPYRYEATVEMIKDQKPDVIGLQEAYTYQLRVIEELPGGYKCVGVGREDGKKKGEHMSIAYNTKTVSVLKWGTFWLSETPEEPSLGWDAACKRTATWAIIKDKRSGNKFFMVNTHLDHVGEVARVKGLELVAAKVKEFNTKNLPVVVTGDFNVNPDSECVKVMREGFSDARETAVKTDDKDSFNNWGRADKSWKIDYIWYKGFETCTEFETVTKPYSGRTFISDHFPVKATLIF